MKKNNSVFLFSYDSNLKIKLKKVLSLLFFLISFAIKAQIWVNPLTTGRPIANYYLGDKIPANTYFQFEIGQISWNSSMVGLGQNSDGTTGWNWADAAWYQDGTGSNKRVQRNIGGIQFTATGTWFVVGRAKANSGDTYTYADEGGWTNETTLTASTSTKSCPYYNVSALGNPTSCSASISGTTASLSWTRFTGGSTNYNVMIVRYPKDAVPTSPVNGTSYALNSSIGLGTVVYATGTGTASTNPVTASTNYDYYFYSENWSYYSSGQKVTALAPAPTITLGSSPSICKGVATASLSYSATTNSPNQYSIVYDSTALSVGFANVTNATLPSSPIVLSVPIGVSAGTYNGVLTVKNSTSGIASNNYPFTITVNALPNTGTLNGLQSFCLNGTSSFTTNGTSGGTWSSSNTSVASVNASGVVTGTGVGSAIITYSLNSSGCTNSSTIAVTINSNTSSSQTISACDSYTWSLNGQTYTTSGTYTYVNGCDTKILNLTITPSTSSSSTVAACGSYTWTANGQTYTSSGIYTSVNGCDTKILNLTITPVANSTTTVSACDTYTWSVNGVTYSQSGTYSFVSGCDTKTLELTLFASTPSSQTITACDSYTWSVNGQTYTNSGTYVFAGTNTAGCSQNQTLYLTINNSTSSTQTVTTCDNYTWSANGQTYTTSGTYTYTTTNASGCTDIKTLNLTINSNTSSTQTVTACDNYTWSVNGQTYTTSGTYTYTSTNASGCTDIKTLILTVTPSTTNTTSIATCDSYTWTSGNNQTYTQSGTYTYVSGCTTQILELTITPSSTNTTNAVACDTYTWSLNGQTYTTSGIRSVVSGCHTEILNLTINKSTTSSQSVSACDSYTWSVNGITYTSSGTYAYTSINAFGCTDVKTLNLTINNSTSSNQTVSACGSYTWSANGQTYTTSGIYTKVGTNASGCTDTKTLNLTISPVNISSAISSWTNGQNDNTIGFGAWDLSTIGSTAGFFTGSSDINNGGTTSWGMYARGGTNVANAFRTVAMNIGNTLSFSMDNGYIDTGKVIGFGLQNNSGQNLMELLFVGGQTNYLINDSVIGFNSTIGYTGGGLDVAITYTGVNTYSITIKTKAGATVTFSGRTFLTQSGGQRPAQIRLFNAGAGSGPNYDLFFNSLTLNNPIITTQPATSNQNICVGAAPNNLSISASGNGLTYQWYRNSTSSYSGATSIEGATLATFTPQNTSAGTTYYYCVVTDSCGTTYSNISGAINVTAPKDTGVLSGNDAICVGGLTTFSTNGTSGGSWTSLNPSLVTINSSGVATGLSSGTTVITYSLNGVGGCPNASVSKNIVVNALPNAVINNNTGVSKITCLIPSINLTATGGTTYSWSNGSTIIGSTDTLEVTSEGTYTVTVTNASGCSTIVNSIITQDTLATSSSQSVTSCDSYTWSVNGQTYTSSGTYTYTSTNASGCTDVKTLVLTINNSTSSSESITACDSYTWSVNGQTYTSSGTYNYTSTNASGCTDYKTLVLNIISSRMYYADVDDDGYGNTLITQQACTQPIGYVINNTDCNDSDASMHATYSFYADTDADGYGAGSAVTLCAVDASTAPTGYSVNNTDCDDSNGAIHVGAMYYVDTDADGYDNGTATFCLTSAPRGYSA
ncbi:beta strand repeat-containing protein, partial [Flavobacterium aciduliphilum]